MTEQTPAEQPPVLVDLAAAAPDDRLAALHAAYPALKAEADAAAERLKAVTDGIKIELTSRAPEGTAKVELRGPSGPPLALRWQVTNRFDGARFKREQPAVHESYMKASGAWVLAPIKGGDS